MRTCVGKLWGCLSLTVVISIKAAAVTFYVDLNSTNPVPPYADWSTAATNIQDAIDASSDGDQIWVNDGVYATGGRVVYGLLTNRVVINKAVTVQSVNGPVVTIIQGNQVAGATNGDSAVRCVYLTNNAVLIGFTLTNGATRSISLNTDGSGGGIWCESNGGVIVSNCVITGNAACLQGGGVYQGTLLNCALANNSVFGSAYSYGGGAYQSYLVNSTISGNSVCGTYGGYGGGTYNANLTNCVLTLNVSGGWGGGAYDGNLVNCTITGNFASNAGGGTFAANHINCINYYNICYNPGFAPATNYGQGSFSYCCTTPLPGGAGNISSDPLLASASHLSINSPCRGAGNAAAASGVDIDGEPWMNPPSIGCDELYPGNVFGSVNVNILASFTNLPVGYPAYLQANISGPVYASKWDFGDGTVVSNEPYMSHTWSTVGDYPVVLTAYNDSYPTGQTATLVMHVYVPTVLYVVISNKAPVAPFDSWAKAATNIQNAVDAANAGNLILVSNGVYKIGSRTNSDGANNRVAVTKPVTLQSVNGRAVTLIDGGNTMRCVYLTNGAALTGFTLTNGNAGSGGGIWCTSTNAFVANCLLISNSGGGSYYGTLSNCTITGSSVSYGANYGVLFNCQISNNVSGGADSSILNNCLILRNSSWGGAVSCQLNNCTISCNTNNAASGGGANYSFLQNCIISGNRCLGGGYDGGGVFTCNLTNCLVIGNSAELYGAASDSLLVNCTVVSNYTANINFCAVSRTHGMENCIVYYNFGNSGSPNYTGDFASYCCTTPLVSGPGNFTNAPLFVNLAGGDYHLQSNSPCINAGNNGYIMLTNDLDGNPRIVGDTVDIGAYEYQTPSSVLSYAWAQQYGLPTDGSVDYLDLDGTGMNNWQKWIAGLNPTNPASILAMFSPVPTNNPSGLVVSWQSVNTRTYFLQSSTDLGAQPAFSTLQSNIVGQAGTTSYTDTAATNGGPYFYRVGVQ